MHCALWKSSTKTKTITPEIFPSNQVSKLGAWNSTFTGINFFPMKALLSQIQWKIDLPNICLLFGVEFESIARKALDLFIVRRQIAAQSAVNKKSTSANLPTSKHKMGRSIQTCLQISRWYVYWTLSKPCMTPLKSISVGHFILFTTVCNDW